MRNRIRTSHSFDKRCSRQNVSRDENFNYELSPNPAITMNKISELYNYYYSYYFPSILNSSKIYFLQKINKSIEEVLSSIKDKDTYFSSINQSIIQIKENIENKYNNDYQNISTSYKEYLKNPKKYGFITHFRKHCSKTDSIAYHPCSNKTQGKLILLPGKELSSSYAICSSCKQCFESDFILLLCISCNIKYYSSILSPKEENNIFPATWEKYHCNIMINEIMKCIKCHNTLYLDLTRNILICKNKYCNFISEQESILWNCSICKEDFRSKAKVYNPLEFQILKKAINIALLLQQKACPKELPCRCEKDLKKLTFFHKEECRGILYKGKLLDKDVIVCCKCHAINFEEKFNWICPICLTKFYLHNIKGIKPFSKQKYFVNRELNKSESKSRKISNDQRHNVYYVKNDKFIEKRTNNIKTKNSKKEDNLDDISNKDISPKNEYLNIKNNNKNMYSRNKNQDNSNIKKKYYSTLKELLKERESSFSRNNEKLNNKNYEKNKSEEISRRPKVIGNIKHYYTSKRSDEQNKRKIENYIKFYIDDNNNTISSLINDIKKENKNIISPFTLVESPNIIDNRNNRKYQIDCTNTTSEKILVNYNQNDNKNFNFSNYKSNKLF